MHLIGWPYLEDLARRSSSEERAVLLHRLADLLLRGNLEQNEIVVELFEDIVCRVLEQVDPNARADFSERVGAAAITPKRVIVALANDSIKVAEPVLRYSPNLTDRDLIEIVENTGPEHLEVIARRIYLSEPLTDALIARRHPAVRRKIAANEGAQISAVAYVTLLDDAKSDHVLQELIALRSSLPQAIKERLLPMLAVEVRRRLSTRLADVSMNSIDQALDAEMERIIERVEAVSDDHSAFINLQAGVEDGILTLDEAIRQACRLNRHDWLIDLIVSASNVERSIVLTVLLMRESRPLTVMLRALGIGGDSFRSVLDLRARHLRVGSNDPRLVTEYVALDPTVATAILRKHQGNPMLVPPRN